MAAAERYRSTSSSTGRLIVYRLCQGTSFVITVKERRQTFEDEEVVLSREGQDFLATLLGRSHARRVTAVLKDSVSTRCSTVCSRSRTGTVYRTFGLGFDAGHASRVDRRDAALIPCESVGTAIRHIQLERRHADKLSAVPTNSQFNDSKVGKIPLSTYISCMQK